MNNEEIMAYSNLGISHLNNISNVVSRNSSYHARREMSELLNSISSQKYRLEHFGYKVCSQNDEDGIIEEIFKRLNISIGTFCEIGVENGLECNSLYLLLKNWRGVWLEGNDAHGTQIASKFSSLVNNKRLGFQIGYVYPHNINELIFENLKKLSLSAEDLDFLSIDIDGMDIHLLSSLNILPKVICIEYNGKFPPPVSLTPVYDESYRWRYSDYMGASLVAINDIAVTKGYSLVGTNITGVNSFFVRNDLLGDKFGRDFSPENLYNKARYYLTHDHFSKQIGHSPDFGAYLELSR
jgi:hypothetical protein